MRQGKRQRILDFHSLRQRLYGFVFVQVEFFKIAAIRRVVKVFVKPFRDGGYRFQFFRDVIIRAARNVADAAFDFLFVFRKVLSEKFYRAAVFMDKPQKTFESGGFSRAVSLVPLQ